MLDKFLQNNEKIEMQEAVDFYPGEGVKAALKSKSGELALTNDRLIAVRRTNSIATWGPVILVIPVVIIFEMSVITAAIVGGLIGGIGYFVISKFIKGKLKDSADFIFDRKDIESVKAEESIKGLWIFVLTMKNGETWSFHTRKYDEWNKFLDKKAKK